MVYVIKEDSTRGSLDLLSCRGNRGRGNRTGGYKMVLRFPKSHKRAQARMRYGDTSLNLLQSGFQAFRTRLAQEIECTMGVALEDCAAEEEIRELYEKGVPENWALEGLKNRL